MANEPSGWILTDPDCLQCCRLTPELGPDVYELAQINSFGPNLSGSNFYQISHGHIYLSDYKKEENLEALAFYDYDFDEENIESHLGLSDDDFKQILAEIHFELENQECSAYECATWNQAVDYVQKLTGMDLAQYKEEDKSLGGQKEGSLNASPRSRLDDLISSAQNRVHDFGGSNLFSQDKGR